MRKNRPSPDTEPDALALMLPTGAEPPNGQYEVVPHPFGGRQLLAEYPNGYGASVIRNGFTFGDYEVAVLHTGNIFGPDEPLRPEFHGPIPVARWRICYQVLDGDVMRIPRPEDVVAYLHKIAHLPRLDDCHHGRDAFWDE